MGARERRSVKQGAFVRSERVIGFRKKKPRERKYVVDFHFVWANSLIRVRCTLIWQKILPKIFLRHTFEPETVTSAHHTSSRPFVFSDTFIHS